VFNVLLVGVITNHSLLFSLQASFRTKKLREITSALKESPGIASLRELAISPYGLVSDQLRRKIWPRLLGLDVTESSMMIGTHRIL